MYIYIHTHLNTYRCFCVFSCIFRGKSTNTTSFVNSPIKQHALCIPTEIPEINYTSIHDLSTGHCSNQPFKLTSIPSPAILVGYSNTYLVGMSISSHYTLRVIIPTFLRVRTSYMTPTNRGPSFTAQVISTKMTHTLHTYIHVCLFDCLFVHPWNPSMSFF